MAATSLDWGWVTGEWQNKQEKHFKRYVDVISEST